jgi:hypothetical protein
MDKGNRKRMYYYTIYFMNRELIIFIEVIWTFLVYRFLALLEILAFPV